MEYEILSDFQTVASISRGGAAIRLRNIVTGTARGIASTHERGICSMAFSTEDSQTLATGAFDGRMKLWDIETGVETATLKRRILSLHPLEHFRSPAPLLSCKFRDEVREVSRLVILDLRTKFESCILPHADKIEIVVFSPVVDVLAYVYEEKPPLVWNVATKAHCFVSTVIPIKL